MQLLCVITVLRFIVLTTQYLSSNLIERISDIKDLCKVQVVNVDVLQQARILIMHIGRSFALDPCGRGFVQMAMTHSDDVIASPVCNLDLLLTTLTKISAPNPPGLWVCSTDMFLHLPDSVDVTQCDVSVISVPASRDYARHHGVFKLGQQGALCDVIYHGSPEELDKCALESGKLPLVSGVQFLSPRVTEVLVGFHTMPPLDACTYMGLDSGAKPIQISLFFDLLLPMCSDVTEESFVRGSRGGLFGKPGPSGDADTCTDMHSARALLWKHLHPMTAKVVLCEGGTHSYMTDNGALHAKHLLKPVMHAQNMHSQTRTHAYIHPDATCDTSSVVINSRVGARVHVGKQCVLSHSHVHTPVRIGDQSIVNGVWTLGLEHFSGVILPDKLILQTFHIQLPGLSKTHIPVLTVLGLHDNLNQTLATSEAGSLSGSFCNQDWSDFRQRTGIADCDLWSPDMPDNRKTLMSARLYPVAHPRHTIDWSHTLWLCGASNIPCQLNNWRECWRLSLEDILDHVMLSVEFDWRERISHEITEEIVRDTIVNQRNTGLGALYNGAVVNGRAEQLLKMLDTVAMEADNPGIAARALANIADVLGAMSKNQGGLRSGPARNASWKHAFQLLESGSLSAGVQALSRERAQWFDSPSQLIRAARHYEAATQILIRHAVITARQFIHTTPQEAAPLQSWVTAVCPARIDIAGGWSDTPPITYEHGGAVLNAAILLDDKRPIGAKVRRIETLHIVLKLGLDDVQGIVIRNLKDFADYTSPHTPGALLKAAFICADIIKYPSQVSLEEQLRCHGGGLELVTWSLLPHGSGLGTSSILAGAIMAALWHVSGTRFDISALNHAVLHLEQMLTTGGGWQDQVGGLTPGIKVGHSPAHLPLQVEVDYLDIRPEVMQAFSDRLVLIYTGKTRLARNLLQNVVRNWYARDPAILATEDQLVETAWRCGKAFQNGNLAEVGACMDAYWLQKKHMAPGCEPEAVTCLISCLRAHAHGISMAGAGGGGFLYVLLRDPLTTEEVMQILSNAQGVNLDNMSVHRACVDTQGLLLTCDVTGDIEVPLKMTS